MDTETTKEGKVKMEHTPGPWKWEYDNGDPFKLVSGTGKSVIYLITDWDGSLEMSEPDKRLIAKAPEMFEMLQGLMVAVKVIAAVDYIVDEPPIIENAKNLIREIEGE